MQEVHLKEKSSGQLSPPRRRIMTNEEFEKHCARTRKIEALAKRGATAGERQAAEAALDRIEPSWRLTDEEILSDLGVEV